METNFEKPLDAEIAKKQNSTDNNLSTTAKTVVGAINENSTAIAKLDKAYDLGNYSSLSSLESAITTFANTLALNETRPIKFYAVSDIGLFKGYNFYAGHLTMLNATTHLYEVVVTSQDGYHIAISYNGSAFKYNELAAKSDIPIITRKTSNHSSSTTNSYGYVEIDSYSSLGVNTSLYCIGMVVRGWTGSDLGMTVTKGSNGTTFYLTGPASTTFTGFSVEYYFVNLVS